MRNTKIFTTLALDANSYIPIDLGTFGLKNVGLQCRTAKDIYLVTDLAGAYWTLKSGMVITLDLAGNMLDIAEGDELVSNGTFTGNATGWTLGADWSYGADKVSRAAAAVTTLSQGITVVANATYKLVYTIGDYVASTLVPSIGGTAGVTRSGAATCTEYIKATNTDGLVFTPGVLTNLSVDTVSVKRITWPTNSVPLFVKGSEAGLYLEIIAIQ